MTDVGAAVHEAFLGLWFVSLIALGIATGPWTQPTWMRQPALFTVSVAIAALILTAALR